MSITNIAAFNAADFSYKCHHKTDCIPVATDEADFHKKAVKDEYDFEVYILMQTDPMRYEKMISKISSKKPQFFTPLGTAGLIASILAFIGFALTFPKLISDMAVVSEFVCIVVMILLLVGTTLLVADGRYWYLRNKSSSVFIVLLLPEVPCVYLYILMYLKYFWLK